MKLIYHPPNQTTPSVSPFDAAIMEMVAGTHVRIACPYLGVEYLNRIIGKAKSWQLLTDVMAWLQSNGPNARPGIVEFISQNTALIHHCPNLHAKVVLTDSAAIFGSANLTRMGITERVEMSALTEDPKDVKELGAWFNAIWVNTSRVERAELQAVVQTLPAVPQTATATLSTPFRFTTATLAPSEPPIRADDSYRVIDRVISSKSQFVQKLARSLLDELDPIATSAKSTGTAGGDIRHFYQKELISEIVFHQAFIELVLTVKKGDITDTEFIWNKKTQGRLDRGRVRLPGSLQIPEKVKAWIELAGQYARRNK